MKRLPVRLRLATMHGVMFLSLGILVLGVTFLMVRAQLPPRIERAVTDGSVVPGEITLAPTPGELGPRIEAIALNTILSRSGLALAIGAAIAVVLSWWSAGRSLRPVTEITAVARKLSDRTLHERIDLDGPSDEIKELADTIDDMLGRLDGAFEAQRRFVGNASHELRTPLTVARTAIDVFEAKPAPSLDDAEAAMAKVADAIERSERLLEALLTLARAEQIDSADEVDLPALLGALIDEGSHQVTLDGRPAIVRGDRRLIERMVANLIDNAVRYGSNARAQVQHGDAGAVVLVVENDGAVIPRERIQDLFSPFVRLQADRTSPAEGLGLGLSIVQAIVRAHGGHIEAEPLARGGFRVEVTLPGYPRMGSNAASA